MAISASGARSAVTTLRRWYRRGHERDAPSKRRGMGAVPYVGGTTFRVWAPAREAVFVTGTFDDWARDTHGPATATGTGPAGRGPPTSTGVAPGDEYRFTIRTHEGDLSRIDPYARSGDELRRQRHRLRPGRPSTGATMSSRSPTWDDLVIYEMHIGTFAASGRSTRHLRRGAAVDSLPRATSASSAVQVMPPFEFAGDISWGYNPAHLFAIESGYGGPDAFKRFIRDAHAHGIAVIVDVVYNHLGPSDLDLWRFDGWARGRLAAGSTSTTTSGPTRHGAPPVPTTVAARCAPSCGTAP